jgi:hypothetical protein
MNRVPTPLVPATRSLPFNSSAALDLRATGSGACAARASRPIVGRFAEIGPHDCRRQVRHLRSRQHGRLHWFVETPTAPEPTAVIREALRAKSAPAGRSGRPCAKVAVRGERGPSRRNAPAASAGATQAERDSGLKPLNASRARFSIRDGHAALGPSLRLPHDVEVEDRPQLGQLGLDLRQ